MPDPGSVPERRGRVLIGVVATSALVYPLLVSAVQLVFVQLVTVDVAAMVGWLAVALACSVALVATVRWTVGRPVRSSWLLVGLAPPAVYEVWLLWPRLAG